MSYQMGFQDIFPSKCFVTLVIVVSKFLNVLSNELFVRIFCHIGHICMVSLSSVGPQMLLQTGLSSKSFCAQIALEGSFSSVNSEMRS